MGSEPDFDLGFALRRVGGPESGSDPLSTAALTNVYPGLVCNGEHQSYCPGSGVRVAGDRFLRIPQYEGAGRTHAAARDLARTQLAVTFLDTIYIANYAHWTLATARFYP